MLADRVRIGRKKGGSEYIGEVYLAQDDDFVKVNNRWVYRGSELEIEIPHIIQGEEVTSYNNMFNSSSPYSATPATRVDSSNKMVTDMSYMFRNSSVTTLDLSSFDTSNVTNMSYMFESSSATTLDLSNFDTSSVTNMRQMFRFASATTGYARTQADADRFNSSETNRPAGLTFIVKP